MAENPPSEYNHHGIAGFDPSLFNNTEVKSKDYSHPFGRFIEQLWPGVWRDQLAKMNITKTQIIIHVDLNKIIWKVLELSH